MRFVFYMTLLALTSCNFGFQSIEIQRAESAQEKKDFKKALFHYERVIKKKPASKMALQSANSAARISFLEVEDFSLAVKFYKHIILYSQNSIERLNAQKKIAEIYFDKLTDYKKSILEYSRLLELPHTEKEKFLYKFNIAKSYFYQNNFFQSEVELNEILKLPINEDQRFSILLFKGNVLLTTKKIDSAILVYNEILSSFPKRSKKESVSLNLAVCYEEKKDFDRAIKILRDMKTYYPTPEFLELKINRLKDRQKNLPGARGFRK